jgi:hypothetical protein
MNSLKNRAGLSVRRLSAVIACHQLEDRIALAVTLGSKHDPFIGPAHR